MKGGDVRKGGRKMEKVRNKHEKGRRKGGR